MILYMKVIGNEQSLYQLMGWRVDGTKRKRRLCRNTSAKKRLKTKHIQSGAERLRVEYAQ